MRNPNGYGSVVYLGKNRRKPYAIRVTNGYKEVNERFRQQFEYLGYFEKSNSTVVMTKTFLHNCMSTL